MELLHETHESPKSAPEDIISSMPDLVTNNILNRLPIQYAVRTCILSKAWKFKWTLLSQLRFDMDFFYWLLKTSRAEYYARIISGLLHHFKGAITKFVLYIGKSDYYTLDDDDINEWALTLSRKGIKELTLYNVNYSTLLLPTHLFTCLKLTHLMLLRCDLWHADGFRGFPNLLNLHLYEVGFKSYKCGEFLSQSPLIETLTLKLTDNTTDKINLVEIAKLENLKMLSLTMCELENMMLITSSSIFQLVRDFPNIQELVLECSECMVLADAEKTVPAALLCLKTLRLCNIDVRSDIMVKFVTDMICGFPNLETLTIMGKYDYNDHVPETSARSTELNCSKMGQLQLREVLIGCIMGSENEISLIKFLLACSPLLKNITIFTRKVLGGKLMFAKKLLKLHRASPVAEIEFHQI